MRTLGITKSLHKQKEYITFRGENWRSLIDRLYILPNRESWNDSLLQPYNTPLRCGSTIVSEIRVRETTFESRSVGWTE